MGISKEKKKEILMQSFDVLKEKIYNNTSEIEAIIEKMAALDKDTSLEMWTYILSNYKRIAEYGNETYHLTSSLTDDLVRVLGVEEMVGIMFDNDFLRRKNYNECPSPDRKIVAYLLSSNQLEKANELINDVYTNQNLDNPYVDDPFGEYLTYIVEVECDSLSSKAVEFLLSWTEKIETEEAKAKLNLALLDYM